MKKAVITILGTIGGRFNQQKKEFVFEKKTEKSYYYSTDKIINIKKDKYINTLPLLIDNFDCDIIPIFTKDAKKIQIDVLKELEGMENKEYLFKDEYLIDDEQNFEKVFNIVHKIINNPEYDSLIIDVTHGFRHLPLLMLIDLMIVHFQNTSKIEKILFAKEEEKPTKENGFIGKYNFIDLKEYLDLANISFILTTFDKNYTVANHIKSKKYKNLINALNNFSDDLMALNLNNMFDKSINELKNELEKIDNISIKLQAEKLFQHIDNKFKKADKRYITYFNLAEELFEKKYMLISLSLLYESLRLYIKTTIKKEHKKIVEKIEKAYNYDLYKIGGFFVKLYKSSYKSKFNSYITKKEFYKIKKSFPKELSKRICINNECKNLIDHIAHKRNNLAHANSSSESFEKIQEDIKNLVQEFKRKCITKE